MATAVAARPAKEKKWDDTASEQEVIALVREWFDIYGEPPREIDWDPAKARRHGQADVATRFEEAGVWPRASRAKDLFSGRWTNMIISAGFYPRHRTKGWIETPLELRADYLRKAIDALRVMDKPTRTRRR